MRNSRESETQIDEPRSLKFRVFVLAAVYAAGVNALAIYVASGGLGSMGVAEIAAAIAFLVTFVASLVLSVAFFELHKRLNDLRYFLAHIVLGLVIGALFVSQNPFAFEWYDFLVSSSALVASVASVAAWLFVFLRSRRLHRNSTTLGGVGFITLLIGFFLLPVPIVLSSNPTDPSCHNVFSGGRYSARAGLRVEIITSADRGEYLRELYRKFATENGMSADRPSRFPTRPVTTICNEDAAYQPGGGTREGQPHFLFVYPHDSDGDWRPTAADLVCFLEKNVAGEIHFTGGEGSRIERPDFLHPECG